MPPNASRDQNYVTTLMAVSSVDGVTPVLLYADPVTHRLLVSGSGGGGSGTVTTVSIVTANGFAGSVANATTTPAITLTTTITGLLKGNGTAISAAVAGTDYVAPGAVTTSGLTMSTATILGRSTAATGAIEEITIGTGLSLAAGVLSSTVTGAPGGSNTQLQYNNAGAFGGITGATSDGTVVTLTSALAATAFSPATTDTATLGTTSLQWSDLFIASGGIINWNNGNILLTHAANTLTLSASDPGAAGPIFEIYHDSASPAVNDVIGQQDFYGRDTAANKQLYARQLVTITDATSASEDASMTFGVVTAGTYANEMVLTGASLTPFANDGLALGTTTLSWADLFLASGGVINFNNGDVTITHAANQLTFAGATTNGYLFSDGPIRPVANDGVALGTATVSFADLFLATGGVINWANGNVTLTHSTGLLTLSSALSIGTANAFTTGTIELGAASDTTISRLAAGVIAVEGISINGYATTATAAGTTTLTIASAQTQFFTGTTTQTVTLPTTSVLAGQTYTIVNNSTGNVTVQSSGANTIQILGAGMRATFTAIVATPTTAANWSYTLNSFTGQNIAQTATANAATVNLAFVTNTITNNSAATLTITLPTAGAIDGEMRIVRVLDFSAVAQTITWVNTQNSTVSAPTTSNGSTTLPRTVGFQYNGASSLWRCIADA